MKILYVERNPIHRELISRHLEREGYEIVKLIPQYYLSAQQKDDGSEYLKSKEDLVAITRANNPDVLLIDRESFKADDLYHEYISAVLNSGYTGKIILTHTHASSDDVEPELGDNTSRINCLGKPFGFMELDTILTSN